MAYKYKQGLFTPKHPEKYIGDLTHIRFLSSWELQMDKFLDGNPNILQWSSEGLYIPYYHPFKKRKARYYPDYWVKFRNKQGKITTAIIEVKPEKQTRPSRSKNQKQRLFEQTTYAINVAKWTQAKKFCDKYGWKFMIITEKEIFRR